MGGKLETIFPRAGHEVVFSYARSRKKLEGLVQDAGRNARAGAPGEAAHEADALLLAVHWSRMADVLKQAGDLSGKVIVSCSLPMNAGNTDLIVGHTSSGAEELAKMLPKARVVSAFNTVPSEVLFGVYEAKRDASPPSLVYCGGDKRGKAVAAGLIRDVGFDPVDAGSPTDRPVHRAIRPARRATGLRGKREPRAGIPFRAACEVEDFQCQFTASLRAIGRSLLGSTRPLSGAGR